MTGFGVMLALGEMSTKFPSKKGFAGHATRCVDPAFGFATALIYLCKVSHSATQRRPLMAVPHHQPEPDHC
jgi:amino acid permease